MVLVYTDVLIFGAFIVIITLCRRRLSRIRNIEAMRSEDLRRVLRWTQVWSTLGGVFLGSIPWFVSLPNHRSPVAVFFRLIPMFVGFLLVDLGSRPILRNWTEPGTGR